MRESWPLRAEVTGFNELTLDAEPGATIAVVGPNGAGKTTLLRALRGLTPRARAALRLGDACSTVVTIQLHPTLNKSRVVLFISRQCPEWSRFPELLFHTCGLCKGELPHRPNNRPILFSRSNLVAVSV
ncbi:ATP-binding cassette domain-containing protein [Streptomyces sp. ISL-1]|uniref:ATP-binding cassette domain-containing protein n=1 Tax=Streptomyces sp. ISL-1 TaxID=2817657 RepID=UPI0035AC24EC